jgi:hypothetical protein
MNWNLTTFLASHDRAIVCFRRRYLVSEFLNTIDPELLFETSVLIGSGQRLPRGSDAAGPSAR